MAYSNTWTSAAPLDTIAANTLADEITQLRLDVEERLDEISPGFSDDDIDPKVPKCRVYHSAAHTAVVQPGVTMAWDSESYDPNTMHDTVTNNSRITVPVAGYYLCCLSAIIVKDTAQQAVELRIRSNGSDLESRAQHEAIDLSGVVQLTLVDLISLAADEYIEGQFGYVSSAGADTVNGADSTFMWAILIG